MSRKEVLQRVESVINGLGLDTDEIAHLLEPTTGLGTHLADLLRSLIKNVHEPVSEEVARKIMGRNIIGISEINRYLPSLGFQAEPFPVPVIPFPIKDLRQCAQTHVLLLDPGLSIREFSTRLPNSHIEPPDFGGPPMCLSMPYSAMRSSPRWRLIKKTGVGLTRSGMGEQMVRINPFIDYVPSACEIYWLSVAWFYVTSESLFEQDMVRTSDTVDSRRICVGFFCKVDGMSFFEYDDIDGSSKFLDLATAIRPRIE